jgi:hypothetical protein
MCRKYKEGECKNKQCAFAHKGDGYLRLVLHTRLEGSGNAVSLAELNDMGLWRGTGKAGGTGEEMDIDI